MGHHQKAYRHHAELSGGLQMLDGNVRFGHMGSHTHDLCPIGPGLLQILNGPHAGSSKTPSLARLTTWLAARISSISGVAENP